MQQIVNHSVTKSFCFFAAGAALLVVGTREIAAVRALIRRAPVVGAALIFGGLAIAGAPPLAVFLSEFAILKAGLAEGRYAATALLAAFIVVAFFGIMAHLNRMVFGAYAEAPPASAAAASGSAHSSRADGRLLPFSCTLALALAAVPVLLLGVYVPKPLHDLLVLAAAALRR
jgi:hydrogenase-4 component F